MTKCYWRLAQLSNYLSYARIRFKTSGSDVVQVALLSPIAALLYVKSYSVFTARYISVQRSGKTQEYYMKNATLFTILPGFRSSGRW